MKVAIVGAGFCGLAVAWHLMQAFPSCKITLFDQKEIGEGTSGIAAGLLHPFGGAHAKYNVDGQAGINATCSLLQIASQALNNSSIILSQGVLRFALSSMQTQDFQKSAEKNFPLVQWFSLEECQKLVPGGAHAPGLWIPSALTIDAKSYIKGLWRACQKLGVCFRRTRISCLADLSDFSLLIFTVGAEIGNIPEFSLLPVKKNKGQLLELDAPSIPFPCPLNSQAYLLMTASNKTCLVGASYERNFSDCNADIETAKKEILPKAFALYPSLQNSKILNCFAGLRASTPTHLPLLKHLYPNVWILTGMGSKGLLYHALYAEKLVQQIKKFY